MEIPEVKVLLLDGIVAVQHDLIMHPLHAQLMDQHVDGMISMQADQIRWYCMVRWLEVLMHLTIIKMIEMITFTMK